MAGDKIVVKIPTVEADPMDALVLKAVESGSVDVLERLLKVKQQVQADRARDAFYSALIGFQNACPVIQKGTTANIKSSTGASFSYSYTPLEDIAHAIRPLLELHQMGYRWFAAQQGNSLTVTCRISHALGHIEETSLTVPVGVDPQRPAWPVAQSLTYAKRYTLCNALGIVVGGEDDDAQEPRPVTPVKAATAAAPSPAKPEPKPAPSAPKSTPQGSINEGPVKTIITDVQIMSKVGATGSPWTRYDIACANGETYSTFSSTVGGDAYQLKDYDVELEWEWDKRSGKYKNCTAVKPMQQAPLVVAPEGGGDDNQIPF
jgi:hypothetical protein